MKACDELLKLLRDYLGLSHILPKSSKTLFGIKFLFPPISDLSGKKYVFFDPRQTLTRFFKEFYERFPTANPLALNISLSIDGVNPFLNSKYCFWTFLFKLSMKGYKSIVFPLSLIYGKGKPIDTNFLIDGIHSINDLVVNGFNNIPVFLRSVICDAP